MKETALHQLLPRRERGYEMIDAINEFRQQSGSASQAFRKTFARHPWLFLGIAFDVAAVLGSLVANRSGRIPGLALLEARHSGASQRRAGSRSRARSRKTSIS